MNNEILWLLMMAVNFGIIMLLYRWIGQIGILLWIPIAVILANIQVIKAVDLFGVSATLGNILYGTTFLVTDILSENHGKKSARLAVYIGFIALIATTLIMNLALAFVPGAEDFSQSSLETIFSFLPRIVLASLVAYTLSQLHDVWAFHLWRKKYPSRKALWFRNLASTSVSQLIDSIIFTFIAFYGVFSSGVFIEILITTYVLKLLVALVDTPMVYIAQTWHADTRIQDDWKKRTAMLGMAEICED
ncbi:queuosine precursor transporter [Spirochaeta dissipatitropha]